MAAVLVGNGNVFYWGSTPIGAQQQFFVLEYPGSVPNETIKMLLQAPVHVDLSRNLRRLLQMHAIPRYWMTARIELVPVVLVVLMSFGMLKLRRDLS